MDLELTLPAEGITAVFGPSGSGKSSFFNAIVGQTKNKNIEIHVNGVDWQKLPLEKRKVVLVRQRPYLFPHLNIEKNIVYGFNRLQPKRSSNFCNEVIEQFNIASLLKQYPAELSGGELQRVAIAQALLSCPKLLLLDEVFSALDEKQKIIIMNNLKAHIEREQICTMFISHSRNEVFHLANQVVLMYNGTIERVMRCNEFMSRQPERVYYELESL